MSFCNCTDITTDFILKSQLYIGKAIRYRELTGFQIGKALLHGNLTGFQIGKALFHGNLTGFQIGNTLFQRIESLLQ